MTQPDPARGATVPRNYTVLVAPGGIGVRDYPNRKRLALTNLGAAEVFAAKNPQALLNAGLPIQPNQMLIDEPDVYGRIYTGAWSFVSVAGGEVVAINEE